MTEENRAVEKRLMEIGVAILAGADPQQFEAELDALLGTRMEDRDRDLEEVWEDSYREEEK